MFWRMSDQLRTDSSTQLQHQKDYRRAVRGSNDSGAINKRGIVIPVNPRAQLVVFSSAAHERGFTSKADVHEAHRALERVQYTQSVAQQVLDFRRQGAADERRFEVAKATLEEVRSAAPRKVAGWTELLDRAPPQGDSPPSVERAVASPISSADGCRRACRIAPRDKAAKVPQHQRTISPQSEFLRPSVSPAVSSRKRQRSSSALAAIAQAYPPSE